MPTTDTHASLTGSDLHESKGASSASANTVAVANGSGSTTWQKLTTSSLDTASVFNTNKFNLTVTFTDVSAPSSIYVPIPADCTLTKVWGCLGGTITTADSIITVYNNAGASMGTMTVAFSGSAAGDVDSFVPASNNTFTNGQMCRVATDGGSSTTMPEVIVLSFTQTG